MLGHSRNVRVLEVGAYDIEGASWPWVDFYDADGREKVLRMGVATHRPEGSSRSEPVIDVSSLQFGDLVDIDYDVLNETKVMKGTDRTFVRHNCRLQQVVPAKTSSNGRADKPSVPAAA